MSEAPREAPVSEERSAAAGVRGFLDASLSRRFAVVLLALLIPIAMVAASVRQGLFANARELIDALRVGALAGKSLVLVLTQDDVTKELFLDPGAIGLAERKIAAYDENLAILSELRELSTPACRRSCRRTVVASSERARIEHDGVERARHAPKAHNRCENDQRDEQQANKQRFPGIQLELHRRFRRPQVGLNPRDLLERRGCGARAVHEHGNAARCGS